MTNRVDLKALKTAASGDKTKKVTVTKAWLEVIHAELAELYHLRATEKLIERQVAESEEGFKEIDGAFDHMDGAFAKMDQAFKKIFKK